MSRRGGHSGASVNAAHCGGASREQAAAAVNVAALARTVHASAPAVAARAEHAEASTRMFVLKPTSEIVVQLAVFLGFSVTGRNSRSRPPPPAQMPMW